MPRQRIPTILFAVLTAACGGASTSPAPEAAPVAPATSAPQSASAPAGPPDPERGRAIYLGNCTACHNMNPALPGALGPEIAGASRELLEARVIRGEYPAGYTPKRGTTLMVPLPQLSGDIDHLHAYLAQPR